MIPRPARASDDGSRDCGTFYLDFVGRFGAGDILVRSSEARRLTDARVDGLIEQAWLSQTARAVREGKTLYDGRLCRLVECLADGRQLLLTLAEVTYREFVGTNVVNPHLRYDPGPEALADPLGVSAAVVSRDGFVLLGLRSRRVFARGGMLHPVGGIMSWGRGPGDVPDPFRAMGEEIRQELGVEPASIRELLCLGVIRDKGIVQPELIFDARVDAEAEDLRQQARRAEDAAEHDDIVLIRDNPTTLETYLRQPDAPMTPVAQAALLLHGLRKWGSGWFATAMGYPNT